MRKATWWAVLVLAGGLMAMPAAWAQRPYIGFVYPAGGQQGTTFQIRLGGQGMDDVYAVVVSGAGVSAKIVEYNRRLNNQEQALVAEQLRDLKRAKKGGPAAAKPPAMQMDMMMMAAAASAASKTTPATAQDALIERLEKRVGMFVQTPACSSISTLLEVEITMAPNAPPGEREIRVVTLRGGASNPLAFHVGQVTEYTRKPMRTAVIQVLGKESLALRKRPPEEAEDHIVIPATLNGQIASGEKNQYRFSAREGQRLVITSLARQLVPYIADAVPGWFQPVMVLYDANGKEVAYDDDYRFKPDPVIWYEVRKTGEYVLAIYDSIYRGREDFVYRITVGELPFVTSIFPLGGPVGVPAAIKMKGWNLVGSELQPPPTNTPAGITYITARRGNFLSNRAPFALDTLPECLEQEANNKMSRAQKVTLPMIVNGRIDQPDDWDVYQFTGKSNETVVAEVFARRLDSQLDAVLKLTDENGKLLAYNDDCDDLGSGLNTHHADSYFMAKLPADGKYYVYLGDTARKGGEEYAYRLRLSAPRPDFALRVAPSSVSFPSRGFTTNAVTKLIKTNAATYASLPVYIIRKDGFTGPIKFGLKDPPAGISAVPVTLTGTQAMTRLGLACALVTTKAIVNLVVEGRAQIQGVEVVHEAVPAEDRMQAFLWRHLLPAKEFKALVFDPGYSLPPRHAVPVRVPPPVVTNAVAHATQAVAAVTTNVVAGRTNIVVAAQGKFTKQQVASRIREVKRLYEEGLLVDEFYNKQMDECEAAIDNFPPPPAATNAPAKTAKLSKP
jgi:hypothetical protein